PARPSAAAGPPGSRPSPPPRDRVCGSGSSSVPSSGSWRVLLAQAFPPASRERGANAMPPPPPSFPLTPHRLALTYGDGRAPALATGRNRPNITRGDATMKRGLSLAALLAALALSLPGTGAEDKKGAKDNTP